ncbi:hypothetical protein [Mesorhizobium sp.]|uniref:hypothetical protein n=1 Tax=Mesorhizobium sp. TaxID=1871066 RepID=UPI00258E46A5|nr:hypothetical protein [Mesorhizobium sp.]
MTTPLPSRLVPSAFAVKASSGIEARTVTMDRKIVSMVMLSILAIFTTTVPRAGIFYSYGACDEAQGQDAIAQACAADIDNSSTQVELPSARTTCIYAS